MSNNSKINIWANHKNQSKFRLNMRESLRMQLALENYYDNTNNKYSQQVLNALTNLKTIRQNADTMEEKELLTLSSSIVTQLRSAIEEIGKEKFVFNKNGCVEYIWENNLQKHNQIRKKQC